VRYQPVTDSSSHSKIDLLSYSQCIHQASTLPVPASAAVQTPPAVDVNTVSDLFLQRNMIREATAFLLDALSGDRPEQAALQTKLLEVNLITNPQVSQSGLPARRGRQTGVSSKLAAAYHVQARTLP
jgi:hypothetical protein